jgi:hypothetical protein
MDGASNLDAYLSNDKIRGKHGGVAVIVLAHAVMHLLMVKFDIMRYLSLTVLIRILFGLICGAAIYLGRCMKHTEVFVDLFLHVQLLLVYLQ